MLESTPVDQRTVDVHADEPASEFVLGGQGAQVDAPNEENVPAVHIVVVLDPRGQ